MNVEKMWEIANIVSAVIGLLFSGILVARFYVPYVLKKYMAMITGIVFFLVMTFLYLTPFKMSSISAYIIGIVSICLSSLLVERRNIPQKIFLSLTIYMFLWVSNVVASLPWEPMRIRL